MSDLISRQSAIEAIFGRSHDIIKSRLKNLPSVEPEIIRCKDCERYDAHNHRCKWWNHGVSNIDWCSYAERRTDGTDAHSDIG